MKSHEEILKERYEELIVSINKGFEMEKKVSFDRFMEFYNTLILTKDFNLESGLLETLAKNLLNAEVIAFTTEKIKEVEQAKANVEAYLNTPKR